MAVEVEVVDLGLIPCMFLMMGFLDFLEFLDFLGFDDDDVLHILLLMMIIWEKRERVLFWDDDYLFGEDDQNFN
ncbi:hypothetical protein HanXRQr2_Chr13g0617871 [Helianthus annuus]|uniref:Uncharacterized protein n=1 Tax=Helianthus annuus TaxID=4232 RepID=A0A9K3ENM1_HELAN|nr:hypothetical protein HanXRQr2_Chr13g0617871 [Helianthus annuus]